MNKYYKIVLQYAVTAKDEKEAMEKVVKFQTDICYKFVQDMSKTSEVTLADVECDQLYDES